MVLVNVISSGKFVTPYCVRQDKDGVVSKPERVQQPSGFVHRPALLLLRGLYAWNWLPQVQGLGTCIFGRMPHHLAPSRYGSGLVTWHFGKVSKGRG